MVLETWYYCFFMLSLSILLSLSLSFSFCSLSLPISELFKAWWARWTRYLLIHIEYIKLVLFIGRQQQHQTQQRQRQRRHWQWERVKEMELRLSRLTAYHFHIAISSVRFDSLAEPPAMVYQSLTRRFCVQINRLTNRPTDQPAI